jgi:hypothetical protein
MGTRFIERAKERARLARRFVAAQALSRMCVGAASHLSDYTGMNATRYDASTSGIFLQHPDVFRSAAR